ncbi:MAG: hypothetical protein LWY06_19355 [Firmicutes bacterium]|nr:hypothetical protein [Bacillota bacterium]
MTGMQGKNQYYGQLNFLLLKNPSLLIGVRDIYALDAFWRGFQQAVTIACEEDFFPEMSGGVPFSWYCETEIGIDERELVGYLGNKHPHDSEAAFSEYLNLILGFIKHSKDFIHKFRKTGNRKSFLRSVKRWMKENSDIPLEHIILREETNRNNGETQYIGFVTNERLQSDNSFENGLIEETRRILGKMV